jgi:uncharacterized membrane protein YfcA
VQSIGPAFGWPLLQALYAKEKDMNWKSNFLMAIVMTAVIGGGQYLIYGIGLPMLAVYFVIALCGATFVSFIGTIGKKD